jgi:hypothetical protein
MCTFIFVYKNQVYVSGVCVCRIFFCDNYFVLRVEKKCESFSGFRSGPNFGHSGGLCRWVFFFFFFWSSETSASLLFEKQRTALLFFMCTYLWWIMWIFSSFFFFFFFFFWKGVTCKSFSVREREWTESDFFFGTRWLTLRKKSYRPIFCFWFSFTRFFLSYYCTSILAAQMESREDVFDLSLSLPFIFSPVYFEPRVGIVGMDQLAREKSTFHLFDSHCFRSGFWHELRCVRARGFLDDRL